MDRQSTAGCPVAGDDTAWYAVAKQDGVADMVTQESFGSLVRRYRREAELTQEALAERAGLSVRAIRDIELGSKRRPRMDTVQLLLAALNVPADQQVRFREAVDSLGAPAADGDVNPRTSDALTAQVLSILIADMRGYTAYTVEHGDEAGAALAQQFAATTTAAVKRYGGTVLELRGDEALCTFASARQAVRAALALQEHYRQDERAGRLPLGVGIGLDAGELVPLASGYRGRALNLAARLCSLARGGDVLVSAGVFHLAGVMEGLSWVDRGPVTLKGLSAPVQVLQIGHASAVTLELPPLQAILASHPTNLPDDPTPFIGREREIDQIAGMLQDPHIRLVTLTGVGGSGKTRLALQVGATLLHEFQDGVFFVNLAPVADTALVPAAIAAVLGITEQGGRDLLNSLAQHLERKHLLLILDNFEHLADASSVVASLLDACRQLHVLVTSRSPLHLSREYEHAVPPLSVPESLHSADPATLTRCEAVALFIDRAKAAKDTFALTEQTAPAVAAICSRLDGLPLAIELAAARIKLFPPHDLLRRLSNSLTLLTGGPKDRPARQQTLRKTIDWSYSLLSPNEQALFAQLSVFAGGCSFEAAESVCDPDGELDLPQSVDSLVDQNLVRQNGDDEPRFTMLETVREYALERLDACGETEALRRRHVDYFLALAEDAEPELWGAEQQVRLEQENENLRAALRWSLQTQSPQGLRLAATLVRFWQDQGYWSEGRRWLESFLAAEPQSEPDAVVRAKALCGAGGFAAGHDEYPLAEKLLQESLALARDAGDTRTIADALGWLGMVAQLQGNWEPAEQMYAESLQLCRALEDREGTAQKLIGLGHVAASRSDPRRARDLYEEALELRREIGNTRGVAALLAILGELAVRLGDDARSEELCEGSLRLARELGNAVTIGYALNGLTVVALARGQYERAAVLCEESLQISRHRGDKMDTADTLTVMGALACVQGAHEQAVELLEEALALSRGAGMLFQMARALCGLGLAVLGQGRWEQAHELEEESLRVGRELDHKPTIAEALGGLAAVAGFRGDHERATKLLAAGDAIWVAMGAVRNPCSRPTLEDVDRAALAAMGEEAFEAARRKGLAMGLEDACAYALDETETEH
jgi:predicted ATPase/class 3 adenylate cyclase